MLRPIAILCLASLAIAGCSVDHPPESIAPPPDSPKPQETSSTPDELAVETVDRIPAAPTKILDQTALARLLGNTGVTLQWIGWEDRGLLNVFVDRGEYWIEGGQGEASCKDACLYLNGRVAEIGADYFIMEGEISIANTPDAGRQCKSIKRWRFEVTQGRKYWRLREFEWCDELTDYIDIYF